MIASWTHEPLTVPHCISASLPIILLTSSDTSRPEKTSITDINPVMEQITEKHKALIGGMSQIYSTLLAMRYLSPSDIIQPPLSEHSLPPHPRSPESNKSLTHAPQRDCLGLPRLGCRVAPTLQSHDLLFAF